MRSLRRHAAPFLALLGLAGPALPRSPEADLPERYRSWLREEVVWIITPEERHGFLALKSDADRDAFIQRFWEIRDPQPLTRQNEFQEEHRRRIAWADRHYSADAARKGSLTERGRVYILLGKPTDVERVVTANETYPYELWFYGENLGFGFPGQLRLLFYRPFGVGEYRLLNPALDAERLFPPSSQMRLEDPSKLLLLVGPEVSQALRSVAPGYGTSASDEVIQELTSPREIPRRIRDRGLALHPEVTARWTLKRVTLESLMVAEPVSDGSWRVHLSVEIPASMLRFEETEKDRFRGRVDVFGDVTDARGLPVARFDEIVDLALSRAELETRRGHGLAYQAVRTLVPGHYHVKLLFQPYRQDELGFAEAELELPASADAPEPRLAPFLLAFRADRTQDGGEAPFRLGGFRLFSRPGNRFRPDEKIYTFGLLRGDRGGLEVDASVKRGTEQVFSATAQLAAAPATGGAERAVVAAIPAAKLGTGRLELSLTLRRGDVVVTRASAPLEVDPGVPGGQMVHAEIRSVPPEVEHYNRGIQLLSRGDTGGAERHFRIALGHRARFPRAKVYLARALLLGGKTEEGRRLLEEVLATDPDDYDALLSKGSLHLAAGQAAEARGLLERALEVGARSRELLNGLGEACLGSEDAAAARRYFEESLRLDPDQPSIRKRLAALGD